MTYLPSMGWVPDRPVDPPEPEGIPCPRCGSEVHDYGDGYDCECGWVDGEVDGLIDAERDRAA